MRLLLFGFLAVAMVAAGCGGDDDAATPTTASAGSDESDEVATTAGADFDVVFDGEECTVTGPESVPAGEYVFVFTDNSDLGTQESPVEMWLREYVDGHRHQELIDIQEEEYGGPGGAIEIRPPWVLNTRVSYDAPELDLEENQTQSAAILEPGPHGMNVAVAGPERQWICNPAFEVT